MALQLNGDGKILGVTQIDADAGLIGFTPVGNLSAGNVQAALAELDSEKVAKVDLAATTGAVLVGYDGGTVQDVLDGAKSLQDYATLRVYSGSATQVRITKNGIAGFFYYDVSDATSLDNGGTVIVASNGKRWKRHYNGAVNVKWFGAAGDWNGSSGTDNTLAFAKAIASGARQIDISSGSYYFASAPVWESLTNITFRGDNPEATTLVWSRGNFGMKSVKYCQFKDIGFTPIPSDIEYPQIFVSNFIDVTFDNCVFRGFGGATANKPGSTCVFMFCSDVGSDSVAAGNSAGGMFLNCRFFGSDRMTNFGVRIHNSTFVNTSAAITGVQIIGCTFGGFNWNAIELAGITVSNCIIEGCVFNACGLVPIDIDKGAHSNTVSNCVINRLLGNIDPLVNPNTRTTVVAIQGRDPTQGYAYNNSVRNIVAYLKKADLDAYGNGCSAVAIAYAKNNTVDGVTVYCDGVPARGIGKRFGLACVSFETASGNQIRNVLVNNASTGIVQTSAQAANMTSLEPNLFENIKNVGTMTEEVIQVAAGAETGAFSRNIIKKVTFNTDLSSPYYTSYTHVYAILAEASGSSNHFLKIEDATVDIPAAASFWFVMDAINNLSLENVGLADNGIAAATRFIHSEGKTNPAKLGLDNVYEFYAQNPIDLATSLQFLNPTTEITAKLSDNGLPRNGHGVLFATATPTYPAPNYWSSHLNVERVNKAAGSYTGWVSISGVWKTYGAVSA